MFERIWYIKISFVVLAFTSFAVKRWFLHALLFNMSQFGEEPILFIKFFHHLNKTTVTQLLHRPCVLDEYRPVGQIRSVENYSNASSVSTCEHLVLR
jgi:hypothetical protein